MISFIPAIKNAPVPQHKSNILSLSFISTSFVNNVVICLGVKTIPFFTFETPAYFRNSS